MDTRQMIAELKQTCETIEAKKSTLLGKVKELDDRLTAYRMAIDSLELTIGESDREVAPVVPRRKREAVILEFNGIRQTIPAWAKQIGIDTKSLRYRLNNGWSIEDALSKPVGNTGPKTKKQKNMRRSKVFGYDAHDNVIRQFSGIGDASRELRLPIATIQSMILNTPKEDQLRSRGYYLAYA